MAEHAAPVRRPAPATSPRPIPQHPAHRGITIPAPGPDFATTRTTSCATDPDLTRSPAVRAALRTAWQPLDPDVQRTMDGIFGFDLSTVRVHTADPAQQSAETMGALAYTVCRDIVFGAGQYAPDTAAGRALLAHELGHVREGRIGPARVLRQPVGAPVAPPTVEDQRQMVEGSISFLTGAAEFYGIRFGGPARRPDQEPEGVRLQTGRLATQLAGWLRTRDTAANLIGTELSGDPVLTERLRTAYRRAVTALLEAAAREGRRLNQDAATAESPYQLFQKHQALIHEWAWPTAVPDPRGTVLLDRLSDVERGRIRFGLRYEVTPAGLDGWFHLRAAAVSPPSGTTVVLAPGGSPRIRAGLIRLAASLVTTFTPPMQVDTTMTMALDLGRYGGDRAMYRFTHVQRPAPGGREVLVERVSSMAPDQRPPQQQAIPDELFIRLGFVRATAAPGTTDWSSKQFALLQSAIAQIPESMLASVRGLTFIRVPGVNPDDAAVGGAYSIEEHAIRVYDTAFGTTTPTYPTPGGRASTSFDRLIAHEIGHALDYAPIQKQVAAYNASIARQSRFHRSPHPTMPGRVMLPPAERPGWDALQKRIERQGKALAAGRALSGQRFARTPAGSLQPTEALPAGEANEFRAAADADGQARITEYSDKSLVEYFAEVFSFYVADPQSLSRLRPHLYAYFARRFPDPQRPTPTP